MGNLISVEDAFISHKNPMGVEVNAPVNCNLKYKYPKSVFSRDSMNLQSTLFIFNPWLTSITSSAPFLSPHDEDSVNVSDDHKSMSLPENTRMRSFVVKLFESAG